MPVTEQTPVVTHNGNGVTTVFAYNYKILAVADMEVTVDGVVKTLTTHYSVSGVGSEGGGSVTMVTAPASGTGNVVLRRNMAYARSNDYQDNGDLLAVTADEDADRPILMLQQLVADLNRAMKLPVGVTTDQVITNDAASRIGKLVSFDGSGNMTLVAPTAVSLVTVSAFISMLLDDVDAATARATLGAGDALQASIQTQSYTKFTAGGTADAITGALAPVIGAYATGMRITTTPAGANTITAPTINLSSLGAKKVFKRDSTGSAVALAAGDYNASGPFDFEYLASLDSAAGGWVLLNPLPATSSTTVPVRQTVLSGPVDSSGFSAFVGSTGSTTVTATGTLKATAAAGGDANYTGSITNPSWTGLSTNGTMYLFLDITSAGVVTTGSTTLAPTYQWGGTYSITNLQNTFNIQEMTMKVGNGSTAAQVYRVFVGEVTVSGGVVTVITWYQLMGRYKSGTTNTLPVAVGTVSFNHNIGMQPDAADIWVECITNDGPFVVGDRLRNTLQNTSGSIEGQPVFGMRRVSMKWYSGAGAHAVPTSASFTILTAANWKYWATAQRSW